MGEVGGEEEIVGNIKPIHATNDNTAADVTIARTEEIKNESKTILYQSIHVKNDTGVAKIQWQARERNEGRGSKSCR